MRTVCTALLSLALTAGVHAQTWMAAPSMGTARTGAAAVVLDGRLVVMGGRDAAGTPLATAEAFDPASGWTPMPTLRHARADAAAAVLDGRIVLSGGRDDDGEPTDDVEVYDPEADRWESFDGLKTEREGHGLATLGGTLIALGGADEEGSLLATSESYTGDWGPYSWTLDPARARFGMVTVGDGVVVVGGFSAFGPLQRVDRFTTDGGASSALAPLPTARGGLAVATDGTAVFAIGGRDASDGVVSTVDRLGPVGGGWTALPSLPVAREGAVAAVIGTELIVAGGSDAFGGVLASVVRLPIDGVAIGPPPHATSVALTLAGPNPTSGPTTVMLRLTAPGPARVRVLDALGREVALLWDGIASPAPLRLGWRADVPAGVYGVRLEAPGVSETLLVTVAR